MIFLFLTALCLKDKYRQIYEKKRKYEKTLKIKNKGDIIIHADENLAVLQIFLLKEATFMRKPKFLAMTLALALVAGTVLQAPVTVRAEETVAAAPSESQGDSRPSESQGDSRPSESQGDVNPAPSTEDKLMEPTDVKWDGWSVRFGIPNMEKMVENDWSIEVVVYRNEEAITHWYWSAGSFRQPDDQKEYTISVADYIMESGTYKVAVSEVMFKNWTITSSSEVVYSEEKVYTVPEERLEKVEAPIWDEDKPGLLYFSPLQRENVDKYSVILRGTLQNDGKTPMISFICSDATLGGSFMWRTEDGKIAVDCSKYIMSKGEGIYWASIQAYSSDIDSVANGYEGDKSLPLDTTKAFKEVSDVISEAMQSGNSAEEKVQIIRENTTMRNLSMAMQTDDAVLQQICDLEANFKEEKNVTIETPKVSAEAAALGVDTSKISMVGAAFNANPNSAVSLAISVPETKVPAPSGYKNDVQLDIKLNGASSSDGKLEMPITITMPAPAGVELSKLVLWHYHGDNREMVVFKDNKDGTITFTVTSFSVFLFTEEQTGGNQTGGDQSSGDQTGSNSTINNNNSTSSSSTSSTQTVTEEKKAPVAVEYVVKRGDNMAKIARRHGLTLGQLIALNPQVKNPARIYAGQVLVVGYTNGEAVSTDTANAEYYIVQRGDSLFKIAVKNKLTLLELKVLNPNLFAQKYIFAGQKVRVK